MKKVPKVLFLGPEDGPQGDFVGALSQVKVRSSARSSDGVVPMHFGRIRLDGGMDLQVYGAEHSQVEVVVDAIQAGLLGTVLLIGEADLQDPATVKQAVNQLENVGIPILLGSTSGGMDKETLNSVLSLEADVTNMSEVTKENTKEALLRVLEGALALTPES